ncbi:hypothetical protein [Actinoplanes sp. NPDC049118]|uniref:hypothetical protein n=1 Tax=Actinoplanes sp. NPDC049118 TaxID=3155769 RepID=UPI003406A52B
MSGMSQDEDFYEEDEQVDDLLAAFDSAAERGKTQRPTNGQTHWLNLVGMASRINVQQSGNTANLFAA